jgi:pyridoxine 5-phosphate synthase
VENVALIHMVPHLEELNIGHSLISRALIAGVETAVREMLAAMAGYAAASKA